MQTLQKRVYKFYIRPCERPCFSALMSYLEQLRGFFKKLRLKMVYAVRRSNALLAEVLPP